MSRLDSKRDVRASETLAQSAIPPASTLMEAAPVKCVKSCKVPSRAAIP